MGRISKESSYRDMMDKIIEGTKKATEGNGSSKPTVIADAVVKIVNSKNPKTRYKVGKYSKMMPWMRVYLGDKMFDKIVMSQM